MFILQIKKLWELINKIHPETRSLIIIILFGYILYSQMTETVRLYISETFKQEIIKNKEAEQYSINNSAEICREVQRILEEDDDAFDVLLLNYHNNTLSLQGYKYLYLSCLTEAPKSLDTPPLKLQWNKIDYIYYADELSRIHNQSFVLIGDIETMKQSLPKLYRLVKGSDAEAASFYTIEGHDSAIGMIVVLYKDKTINKNCNKVILHCILKLAILLDYEHTIK